MGTWLATVRFPDGTARYAAYSTVSGSMSTELHAMFHVEHYRESICGDPLPRFPEAPRAPIDQLIPVEISHAPDDYHWAAVYCPRRAMVLGPLSPYWMWRVQESHEMIRGVADELRHLSQLADRARCGAPVSGTPLPYRRYAVMGFADWDEADQPPEVDIFATWNSPDICRECLAVVAAQDR
ncbi:hypothetical protein GCM10010437_087550 [Actinoplanes palleronii]